MRYCLPFMLSFVLLFGACDDPLEEDIVIKDTEQHSRDTTDKKAPTAPPSVYFPPLTGDWQAMSPDSLGWNAEALQNVLDFVASKNSHGFMIIKDGYVVVEKYWNGWDKDTQYPVASAGKSIAAFLVGVAQQQGLLNISNKTSDYLGLGWTSAPAAKEALITIRHQLAMTTGLDESEDQCTAPACLRYKADAGKRWAYHNGPYNLLHHVIEKVSGKSMDEFTRGQLAEKIGLKNWTWEDYNLKLSTRDMARFGLLIMHRGEWNGNKILTDQNYFNEMTQSAANQNPSYGYLWWLNGKSFFRVPGDEQQYNGSLTAPAPDDMISAMGKGDKKIYVIPSLKLVVVRHGDDTGEQTFGPSSFDSELWSRLMPVFNQN